MLGFMVQVHPGLGGYLDRIASEYGSAYLHTDPIGEVRRFADPDDREVAAFLAAGLAFGRVSIILEHLQDLWSRLEYAPARTVDAWTVRDARRLDGFTHRWVTGPDLARVLHALGRARRRHGSLRALFLAGYDPGESDLAGSLTRFVTALRSEAEVRGSRRVRNVSSPAPRAGISRTPAALPLGVATFFPDPARGGACKRLNLFLRWMVRPDDGVDLGLLDPVRRDQLVIPLDTHVSRISRYLGLTNRRAVDWKMAREVTDRLRVLDPVDPVRYDFALSRLGILDACPRRVDPGRCAACALVPACTLGREHHG